MIANLDRLALPKEKAIRCAHGNDFCMAMHSREDLDSEGPFERDAELNSSAELDGHACDRANHHDCTRHFWWRGMTGRRWWWFCEPCHRLMNNLIIEEIPL